MFYDYGDCQRCNGEGYIVVCIDDLCRNTGECMHGDGYGPCPECKGTGEVEYGMDDDYALDYDEEGHYIGE